MAKKEIAVAKGPEEYAGEAVRYYRNARRVLRSTPIRDDRYADTKSVREACGTGYLALLAAVRSFLMSQGVAHDKLPESYEACCHGLGKYSSRNGKVKSEFAKAYTQLHLDGYYTGFRSVDTAKDTFARARFLIERLTGRSVAQG